jgi:hypothetical protein
MFADRSLEDLLRTIPGVSHVDVTPDKVNSVSSAVARCVYDGDRAVAAASDTKTQIGALLDLVDLHLHGADRVAGAPVRADRVTCLVVEDDPASEAIDALRTLAACLRAPFEVRLLRVTTDGTVRPVASGTPDLSDIDRYRYKRWRGLLAGIDDGPPTLVRDVIAAAARPELRAYPMLSGKGTWSLRVEGLEVGRFGPGEGVLGVGKDGKTGKKSAKRQAWIDVAGHEPVHVKPETAQAAGRLIDRFAQAFLGESNDGVKKPKQDEHALESRVLRGVVQLILDDGTRLELLTRTADELVNWGSQFPTRWGRPKSSSARYLDALLRVDRTPWAVEIKVDGGGGTGRYYRHAVAQAVLYREFIRHATPLSQWFARHGLDQCECRAAVAVPEFARAGDMKEQRLAAVCRAFGVQLLRVPRGAAGLAVYEPEPKLVAGLDEFLRALDCPDVGTLSEIVDDDAEPDMWVSEIDGAIEVGSGTSATCLEFPFAIAEFWEVVREVEQQETERMESEGP